MLNMKGLPFLWHSPDRTTVPRHISAGAKAALATAGLQSIRPSDPIRLIRRYCTASLCALRPAFPDALCATEFTEHRAGFGDFGNINGAEDLLQELYCSIDARLLGLTKGRGCTMRFQRSEHSKLKVVVRITFLWMLLSGTLGCLRANPTGELFAVSIAPQAAPHKDEQPLSMALTEPYLGYLNLDACAEYKSGGNTTLYAGRAFWSHEATCAEIVVNNASAEDMRIDLNGVQFTALAVKKKWKNRGKVFPAFGGMQYSDIGNSLVFIDEIYSDITPFQPSNRKPELISRDELRHLFSEDRENVDSLIEEVPASLAIPPQGISLIRVCFRVGYIKEGICELPISFEGSDERVIARIHLKLGRIYLNFSPEGEVESIEKIVLYDE